MSRIFVAVVRDSDVILFSIIILAVFILIVIAFYFGAKARRKAVSRSPYTGVPLRRASDLPYDSARAVLQFLYDRHEYDNRLIDLKRAAVCRETGRIFPNCVTWLDTIHVDWDFLQKRFPGNWVSWGSLVDVQKVAITDAHESLEGFQTAVSCSNPSPKLIEQKYVFVKPGPLYVDMDTKILMGWQCVTDTDFEVLIVQRPKKHL